VQKCKTSPFWWVALMCVLLFGCSGKSKTPQDSEEATLSKLSMIRSHHRRAAISLKLGHRERAIEEMDKIIKISFPRSFRAGKEAIWDAWARKAMMQMEGKQVRQALTTIDTVIASLTPADISFYTAHLYHVRGRILEEIGQPQEALNAYQRSIEINKKVIAIEKKKKKIQTGVPHKRPRVHRRAP